MGRRNLTNLCIKDRSALGYVLSLLGEKLDAKSAAAVAPWILVAMQDTAAAALPDLVNALGSLAKRLEPRDVMSILKLVVCVGETRKVVLAAVKDRAGWKSDGDLWMAIQWAESQGVDVKKGPRWPLAR